MADASEVPEEDFQFKKYSVEEVMDMDDDLFDDDHRILSDGEDVVTYGTEDSR